MKKTLIILGAGVMQGPAITIAKELGFFTIALDGSITAPCASMADRFEQIDLKDKEGIETFARSLQAGSKRLGIMTAGTDFSASVAWTAEKLGLPGIPYEAALNASDKSRMRECFKKAALPSPEFFTISACNEQLRTDLTKTVEDAGVDFSCAGTFGIDSSTPLDGVRFGFPRRAGLAKASPLDNANIDFSCAGTFGINSSTPLDGVRFGFPIVIKPVDNMGSRGCRRVDRISEFEEAAKNAINFSRSGRAIAELFMDGPEFSVDAIVYRGEITICGLADRHIFFPPYFIEMGHTMPTVIEEEKQNAILKTFRAGIHALGIAGKDSIGAAKGDIKLTSNGPMIGEIAARLSGGYMSGWTYPYSSGVLPVRAAILAAMGYKPDALIPQKKWTCAERAFISIPGTVKEILGISTQESKNSRQNTPGYFLRGMENINDFFLRIKEGDKVSFPENNVTKCGNIIASAPERNAAVAAAEKAARSILIRLDPADKETEKFLADNAFSNEDICAADKAACVQLKQCAEKHEDKPQAKFPDAVKFPPDAFELTSALKDALNQLPDSNTKSLKPGTSAACSILPFPAFQSSGLRDYMGRTVEDALAAVKKMTGVSAASNETILDLSENAENIVLGRSFWAAMIRGSYQGAVYYIDKLGIK